MGQKLGQSLMRLLRLRKMDFLAQSAPPFYTGKSELFQVLMGHLAAAAYSDKLSSA